MWVSDPQHGTSYRKKAFFLVYDRSSLSGCSLPDTEDLYFDDELHPSLERDPNMQLLLTSTTNTQEGEEEDMSPALYPANIFDTYDGGE